ncbi:MAG: DUF438 domain-containing protein [Spirochaetia bacterium]|jgi:DUF438 domain-containing protein|nr:DUF438 domain-containing protein [Spirochaetia bacterium]
MSEMIRNNEEKQKILKEIVTNLSEGSNIKSVQKQFKDIIKNVSPEEIASMEQSLIDGGVPVEHVQSLCDVHVKVFEDTLEKQKVGKVLPGHPVHTYKAENIHLRILIKRIKKDLKKVVKGNDKGSFKTTLTELREVEIHYQRKENQLFPFLEEVNFTGPSRVMWGKQDEIRVMFKEIDAAFTNEDMKALKGSIAQLTKALTGMIFMEEKILFPTAIRKLPETSWKEIRRGESAIGYAWIKPGNLWDPNVVKTGIPDFAKVAAEARKARGEEPLSAVGVDKDSGREEAGQIPLDVGSLTGIQLNMMLKVLPIDISYVDENDRVLYYSQGKERMFPRSPGIIGRTVQNCHPPKSAHIVQNIVDSFRKKEKDEAEFYFTMNGRFLHIRYFPLYDENGDYKGVIEAGQDLTDIRALEGEQKLLDW